MKNKNSLYIVLICSPYFLLQPLLVKADLTTVRCMVDGPGTKTEEIVSWDDTKRSRLHVDEGRVSYVTDLKKLIQFESTIIKWGEYEEGKLTVISILNMSTGTFEKVAASNGSEILIGSGTCRNVKK